MTRVEIAGGSYGEALPGGAFAVLVSGRHIQTHQGHVPLPDEDVLFLRCTDVDGFKLAGQGHGSGDAWKWQDGIWDTRGTTHGVSPCIFDQQGLLHVATVAQGSQGYRYVADDGRLVTGDETYADPSRRIWEYTTFGDVTIGQGEAYALAIGPSGRRLLEPGDCRFIRVTRSGEQLAVTIVKLAERTTVLLWLTVAELAGLPLEPSTHPPPPPPEPQTMQYQTGPLNTYAQRRWQELIHSTREEQAAALFRILYEFRQQTSDPIEVFRKGTGGTHFLGSDGHGYAEDICVINEGAHGKWYKDVGISFGASAARLDFGGEWLRPTGTDADRCVPPPPPADVVEPPPPPPPPTSLESRVVALESHLKALEGAVDIHDRTLQTLARTADALSIALDAHLTNHPSGDPFDPSAYDVTVLVGRSYGHTHTAHGTIRRKP